METRTFLAATCVAVLAALVALVTVPPPSLSTAASPVDQHYVPADIARGAQLAAIGDCSVCHTADGGLTFAGGRPIGTPFGAVFATNITPDVDTGIGRWTPVDFSRAMSEGVAPGGRQLYPAFPYDHYTHVSSSDLNAIYAYVITRAPVHAATPANSVLVPRPLVAVWKALYLERGPVAADPAHSAEWNRGRYLVDGLGHCGACHTPRNALGGEKAGEALSGGDVEGWRAPALNEHVAAPSPWTVEQMTTYLRTGFDDRHGIAAGPMAGVARNLSTVAESDVRAIAEYITERMGSKVSIGVTPAVAVDADGDASGARIYDSTCAGCHDRARRGIALDRSTTVTDTLPTNLLRITLDGIAPPEGQKGPIMPGFRGSFTDAQLTDLVAYIRAHYGRRPPWADVATAVTKAQKLNPDGKNS